MGGSIADRLNQLLQANGVDPSRIRVSSCDEKEVCLVEADRDIGDPWLTTFKTVDSLSEFVFQRTGFQLPAGVINPQANKVLSDWSSRGLSLSPGDFDRRAFAFHVRNDSSVPPSLSPFHQVTLKGHPDQHVPWTDPYLLAEWESFLLANGVTRAVYKEDNKLTTVYFFKDAPLVAVTQTENQVRFQFYDQKGNEILDKVFHKPEKPEVVIHQIVDNSSPQPEFYRIGVLGHILTVFAFFPESCSPDQKKQILFRIGETFRTLPASEIAHYLNPPPGEEKALRIVLATREEAMKRGFISQDSSNTVAGIYHSGENFTWLGLIGEGDPTLNSILHEIGGHADADLRVPENLVVITSPDQSALRDYYVWKVQKVATPDQIAAYEEALRLYKEMNSERDFNGFDYDLLGQVIDRFHEAASRHFLSTYALAGPRGIQDQALEPHEDYAEVRAIFLELLAPQQRGAQPVSFHELRSRDPLIVLMALGYLMDEYQVSEIGGIKREELFSEKAFREVLGIDLKSMKGKKLEVGDFRRTPEMRWVLDRKGPVLHTRVGFSVGEMNDYGRPVPTISGPEFSLRPGYRFRSQAVGIKLEQGFFSSRPVSPPSPSDPERPFAFGLHEEIGLWGQLMRENRGRAGAMVLLEPTVGFRSLDPGVGPRRNGLSVGGAVGAALLDGAFGLFLSGDYFQGGGVKGWRIGMAINVDLYHMFIR
ncbi:MAG: hypothetical protein HYT76_07815 [Deltaproteobacteria bacterium]|nr:hypothetical protein [Deltaproteobacteria bacterium]